MVLPGAGEEQDEGKTGEELARGALGEDPEDTSLSFVPTKSSKQGSDFICLSWTSSSSSLY